MPVLLTECIVPKRLFIWENRTFIWQIFAHHHSVLDGVEQSLLAAKIQLVRIDGSLSGVVRKLLSWGASETLLRYLSP